MKKYYTPFKIKKYFLKFTNCPYYTNKFIFIKKYYKKIFSLISDYNLYLCGYTENRNVSDGTIEVYNQEVINYLKKFVDIKVQLLSDVDGIKYKDQFEINEKFYYFAVSKQDGSYIGVLDEVLNKINNGVIQFFRTEETSKVASIGFDPKKQEWHGWSHRAWSKFKIGHVVKKGSCEASSGFTDEYLQNHPEENKALPVGFVVKTLDDAKRCAIAFADSVS